ncbi:MAG: hypothetical protein M4D80_05905 [Myxococcota bacterium]|nr:hypothetical protein [Myxococcota bacterium]
MTYWRSVLVPLVIAACSNGGGDESPPPPDGPGGATNATFNWTIVRNGVMSTCAAADADEVKIEAAPESGVPISHTFQCVLLPGTLALPPGRYAISAQLYDGRGPQVRAFAPAQPLTVPATGTAPAMTFNFSL